MSPLDYAIIGIILISAIISIVRGFVREVLSLITWIVALWVAFSFCNDLAIISADLEDAMAAHVGNPILRVGISFLALFFLVLIIGGLINFLIGRLILTTGLSGTDRVLGVCFGLARGILCTTALVLAISLTKLTEAAWWEGSLLAPEMMAVADALKSAMNMQSISPPKK